MKVQSLEGDEPKPGMASAARLAKRHHQRDTYDAGAAETPARFIASVRNN
jgi:hypothetical protein